MNFPINYNAMAKDINTFNERAGNNKRVTKDSLLAQSKVFFEEAEELHYAIKALHCLSPEDGDVYEGIAEEVLDGAVDTLYTFIRLSDMLNEAGFKVGRAFSEVHPSNLTKVFHKNLLHKVELDKGVKANLEVNGDWCCYKDDNGKVVKHHNHFKPVVLDKGLLPNEGELV